MLTMQALGKIHNNGNLIYELDLIPVIDSASPEPIPPALREIAELGRGLIELVKKIR